MDALKQIEREIQEDFERTDREIAQLQNYDPKGLEKWEWLVGGIIMVICGIAMVYAYYNIYDMLELLFFGIVILISGVFSLVYREIVLLLL